MRLLIDGYNLLFQAGIPGHGHGVGPLERSRLGLLKFLSDSLEPALRPQTTVVFDARNAPPGVPRQLEYHGISVIFAARHEDADTLIEELIAAKPDPRSLTVVSSDHRIQRAARRRKATAVDSEPWADELLRRRRQHPPPADESTDRLADEPMPNDVAHWLAQFGGEEAIRRVVDEESDTPSDAGHPPSGDAADNDKRPSAPRKDDIELFDNPFPPGYGEDMAADGA